MILFPAIDLKNGSCVRLIQGDMNQATIFNNNPVEQATIFSSQGFKWLHIVDLDGAFAGKSVNKNVVENIVNNIDLPVQLGGGIRTLQNVEDWLKIGIKRVILGTVAVKNPNLVKEACRLFPGQIVVGIDAKGGFVATEGWAEVSEISVIELAKKFQDAGVAAIIYTDIGRDGLLKGPDLEGTEKLANAVGTPIIASGGVSSLEDLRNIKKLESDGVVGVISGRAIYDKKFDINQALEIMNHA